jgi:hypothetical protein
MRKLFKYVFREVNNDYADVPQYYYAFETAVCWVISAWLIMLVAAALYIMFK